MTQKLIDYEKTPGWDIKMLNRACRIFSENKLNEKTDLSNCLRKIFSPSIINNQNLKVSVEDCKSFFSKCGYIPRPVASQSDLYDPELLEFNLPSDIKDSLVMRLKEDISQFLGGVVVPINLAHKIFDIAQRFQSVNYQADLLFDISQLYLSDDGKTKYQNCYEKFIGSKRKALQSFLISKKFDLTPKQLKNFLFPKYHNSVITPKDTSLYKSANQNLKKFKEYIESLKGENKQVKKIRPPQNVISSVETIANYSQKYISQYVNLNNKDFFNYEIFGTFEFRSQVDGERIFMSVFDNIEESTIHEIGHQFDMFTDVRLLCEYFLYSRTDGSNLEKLNDISAKYYKRNGGYGDDELGKYGNFFSSYTGSIPQKFDGGETHILATALPGLINEKLLWKIFLEDPDHLLILSTILDGSLLKE